MPEKIKKQLPYRREALPHPYVRAQAVNCDFCKGTGCALSLGFGSGISDICHHCNGLGKVDAEHGAYHVDVVIQLLRNTSIAQRKTIRELQRNLQQGVADGIGSKID